MLRIGIGIYVRIGDDDSRRVLHPANIVRVLRNTYSAEIKGEQLAIEEGHEFHVYYVLQREFVQQAAKIESVAEDGETFMITFATVGEPTSAEGRQQFRVSTFVSDVSCSVGDELDCKVLDISEKGISALATREHAIGAVLDIEVRHDGQCYSGKASVLDARSQGEGLTRYGLLCVDEKRPQSNLAKGLQHLTMVLRRRQLQRHVRNACSAGGARLP